MLAAGFLTVGVGWEVGGCVRLAGIEYPEHPSSNITI